MQQRTLPMVQYLPIFFKSVSVREKKGTINFGK